MRTVRLVIILGLWIALASPACPEDWPCWRGPRGDGSSHEASFPTRWSETENVAWKTEIPGKGHSSPIIWADRIFLTTCIEKEGKRILLCLDRKNGQVVWEREVLTAPLEHIHTLNSFSSATPSTDGQHVWVSFLSEPRMIVACYDWNGNESWRVSPGNFSAKHGFCTCPVLYKDLIILNGDQDGPAWIVALDKATGVERWRTARPGIRSYCTPLIVEAAGKKQLIMTGSNSVTSYDPDTGKRIWFVDGPTEQFVASPVFTQGIVFLTAGFPEYHIMAIRPDGTGNVTNTHVLWRDTKAAGYVPSPIAYEKYFFLVNDGGIASCLDAHNGKRYWLERLGKHHSASPVSAGGLLYFLDDDGFTYVIRASPKFEIVARNALHEECYASPALSRGQIFIRTLHHLYCIGKI